jgi:hypothetical protein
MYLYNEFSIYLFNVTVSYDFDKERGDPANTPFLNAVKESLEFYRTTDGKLFFTDFSSAATQKVVDDLILHTELEKRKNHRRKISPYVLFKFTICDN